LPQQAVAENQTLATPNERTPEHAKTVSQTERISTKTETLSTEENIRKQEIEYYKTTLQNYLNQTPIILDSQKKFIQSVLNSLKNPKKETQEHAVQMINEYLSNIIQIYPKDENTLYVNFRNTQENA